jgi:hypothetical protein
MVAGRGGLGPGQVGRELADGAIPCGRFPDRELPAARIRHAGWARGRRVGSRLRRGRAGDGAHQVLHPAYSCDGGGDVMVGMLRKPRARIVVPAGGLARRRFA